MNVPKQRFKEFNDDWISKTLNDISCINPKNEPLPENFIYIDLESVNNGILFHKKTVSKKEAPSRAQRTVKKNDILFQTVRPYQQNNYFVSEIDDKPYIASTGYALIRTTENPYFIYSLLYRKSFLNKVLDRCTGTSFPAINSNDLGNIKVNLPTINEQTKIANFLSLLDKKIELQTKKIEDLKLYKLCLKNRVFNESDMLRDKLNNLCHCKASSINLSDIEFDNGKFPIYGATGEIKKISTFQFSKNYIAIVKDGASVGKTIICDSNSSIIATMNAIIPNKLPIYYFNELIENINFSKYIVGSGIPHIYFKDYSLEIVKIHSRPRMKLIDSIFNDLLKKIVYEEDKLKKLLQLKKGLMQNMFV